MIQFFSFRLESDILRLNHLLLLASHCLLNHGIVYVAYLRQIDYGHMVYHLGSSEDPGSHRPFFRRQSSCHAPHQFEEVLR